MKFGLIGFPLTHSFSKNYFEEKFVNLGLVGFSYSNYPIEKIEEIFPILHSDVFGLNITVPYKPEILNYLNVIDNIALQIGAVNTLVRIGPYSWKGFNTDVYGFKFSLRGWMKNEEFPERALILGTGGAAKAIHYALESLNIKSSFVSRSSQGDYTYGNLTKEVMKSHLLIINATPSGTFPNIDEHPMIPYEFLSKDHWLFDVVYNPANTLFLTRGEQMGAKIKNGLEMLHLQAEEAWLIWKTYGKF